MPHFLMSYYPDAESGFDTELAMRIALETGAQSGVMQAEDIKVRLERSKDILFGDGRRSYLHVEISLLAGRTPEAKLALSSALVEALRTAFPRIAAISCDIRDMDPACYKKSLV